MFLRDESVERVEQRGAVRVREQQRLPVLPGRLDGPWCHCLSDNHLGTEAVPIAAGQHVGLDPLDVDLEEVDFVESMCFGSARQRNDRQPQGTVVGSEGFGFLRILLNDRRETVEALDQIEVVFAALAPNQRARHGITRVAAADKAPPVQVAVRPQ